jgi:hypothetical protein
VETSGSMKEALPGGRARSLASAVMVVYGFLVGGACLLNLLSEGSFVGVVTLAGVGLDPSSSRVCVSAGVALVGGLLLLRRRRGGPSKRAEGGKRSLPDDCREEIRAVTCESCSKRFQVRWVRLEFGLKVCSVLCPWCGYEHENVVIGAIEPPEVLALS